MSKLEKVCRLAGAGGILAALVMLPVLLVGTARAAVYTDAFYVNYFANAQLGSASQDDVIRIVDTNVRPLPSVETPTGPAPLCAMVYVFDEFQEMQECCGCPVSAGGRLDLSVDGLTYFPTDDFETTGQFNEACITTGDPFPCCSGPQAGTCGSGILNSPSFLYRGTIKIVSTNSTLLPIDEVPVSSPCAGYTQVYCDATNADSVYTPTGELRAWSTHLLNVGNGFISESRFEKTHEPDSDFGVLTTECGSIHADTNYSPTNLIAARGNCAAVCAAPGSNPYPSGRYGSAQWSFIENEPGQEYPGGLCYTGQ